MTANQYDAIIDERTMDVERWTMVIGLWSIVEGS
jgi:hypothetical protein